MTVLHDMHCHLSFLEDGVSVAQQAQQEGMLMFSNTVTPDEWAAAKEAFSLFSNVRTGFGAHPWWACELDVAKVVQQLEQAQPHFIGEVGLDFGKQHEHTRETQMTLFRQIMQWAANKGNCLVSVHAVHSAPEALALLEQTGALDSCTCIFHWFSGPSDTLKRALDAGCLFSMGARMVATRRGREYARTIPIDRILLETDLPSHEAEPCTFSQIEGSLRQTAELISSLKGEGAIECINDHAAALLQSYPSVC